MRPTQENERLVSDCYDKIDESIAFIEYVFGLQMNYWWYLQVLRSATTMEPAHLLDYDSILKISKASKLFEHESIKLATLPVIDQLIT